MPPVSPADSAATVQENLAHRAEVEQFFREDHASPFRRDATITFTSLSWFPVNPAFKVQSVLHRYAQPETVVVLGTGGEQRRQLRYGYFRFDVPDDNSFPQTISLNVYKSVQRESRGPDYLSIWFTDSTTGKETYHVGRYVDVGVEHTDAGHLYTIDLNKAYNPYCAYSDLYSCAIPRKEDHIPLALRVGEKIPPHATIHQTGAQ